MRVTSNNEFIKRVTTYFWADDLAQRKAVIQTESPYPAIDDTGLNTPLFICVAAMPGLPTFLHVFEAKYRAMIDRVWADGQGRRHFGMVAPDRNSMYGIAGIGVHLRIDSLSMLEDGRSYMETVGTSRFRIHRHNLHPDGYVIADVEDFDDVSLFEQENREAAEISAALGVSREELAAAPRPRNSSIPVDHETVECMTTRELIEWAYGTIRESEQITPNWISSRLIDIYGEVPNDPVKFPWWLGCIMQTDDMLKTQLLSQVTVRDRMKISCHWILDWKAQRDNVR